MRVFLGGVVVGCLSSAGAFLANSFSQSPSTSEQPPSLPTIKSVTTATHSLTPTTHAATTTSPQPTLPPPGPTLSEDKTQVATQTNLGEPAGTTTSTSSRAEEILTHGWHSSGTVRRVYNNHVLEYDCGRRIPVWVAEHLTQDMLKGSADRSRAQFRSDRDLPWECRADNSDYRGSGWSRGHMAPAADSKFSQGAMDDTFLLSNILPQDFNNNAGFWNRFEIFCRDLTQKYKDVWVTSGPLFMPTQTPEEEGGDGKKRVTYEVIGESEVAVPTHLYKVIVTQTGDQVATGAFIVPNKPLGYEHHLTSFQVPIQHLERKAGQRFYTNLDRSSASDLCEETGCNLLSKRELDVIIYTSRMGKVGNLDKLAKLWKEIKEKEVPVTPKLQKLYERKLDELNGGAAAVEREKGETRAAMRSG